MRRLKEKFAVLLILVVLAVCQLNSKPASPAILNFRSYLISELNALSVSLEQLQSDSLHQKEFYLKAREHYKHVECFIEYYSPREAKLDINGPLVPKHDIENGKTVITPKGFQKIEELLYSDEPFSQQELLSYTTPLLQSINKLRTYYAEVEITGPILMEMPQLQFHRLASLTLNGYDATISLVNIQEAVWSLEGVSKLLNCLKEDAFKNPESKKSWQMVEKQLKAATKFLEKNTDYSRFNRLAFITDFLDPLNSAWIDLHNKSGISWQDKKQALRLRNKGLFNRSVWNLPYFSIYYADTLQTQLQAELGKLLFFDPILSGNNERACAGCHNPDKAFAESAISSLNFDGENRLERNAPTLLNVSLQQAFFHDGRVGQLEQQAFDVVHNKNEMSGNLVQAAKTLSGSSEYKSLFRQAFPKERNPEITEYQIQKALAEYERSLVTLSSRFDKYIAGDHSALDAREKNGFNLFAGKALCGSCHFFPLFNGTVPPFYSDSEFEIIGTPKAKNSKELSADVGRYKITKLDMHQSSFKTPTVRNIALTAPYMHNGVYSTLEEVVEFYHKGGGKGLGIKIDHQTLPFDSLQLSAPEKEDIVLFLKSLTDTQHQQVAPAALPQFDNNAVLNRRKIGGLY